MNKKRKRLSKTKPTNRKHNSGPGKTVLENIPLWMIVPPFLLAAGLVPAVMYGRVVPVYEQALRMWNTDDGMIFDVFSYQKAWFVVVAGILALVLVLLKRYGEGLSASKRFMKFIVPVGVYTFFVIASTIFSKYPKTSLNGFVERYEGMWVLLAYMFLYTAALLALDTKKRVMAVLWSITIASFVVLGVGTAQYFEMDPFRSERVIRLILPRNLWPHIENLRYRMGEGRVYATLYNPNYVGSYSALVIPMFFGMLFAIKRVWLKPIPLLGIGLAWLNLEGSRSTAGQVGLITAFAVIGLLFMINLVRKYTVLIIAVFLIWITAFVAFLYVNFTDYRGWNVIDDLKVEYIGDEPWFINDLKIMPHLVVIDTNQGYLEIRNTNYTLTFWDEHGDPIKPVERRARDWRLDDPRYEGMRFVTEEELPLLTVHVRSGRTFMILLESNGFYDPVTFLGYTAQIQRPKVWLFEGYETMGSSRGYIWGRSIPIIFHESFWLGGGPDTYAYLFPQNDIAGKMNAGFGSNRTLVDKPHSMYMQMGINTGFFSMLAILALFFIYTVHAFAVLWKIGLRRAWIWLSFGLIGSNIGFMVSVMFNDTTVGIAPMFWVLLGCSSAVHLQLAQMRKETPEYFEKRKKAVADV